MFEYLLNPAIASVIAGGLITAGLWGIKRVCERLDKMEDTAEQRHLENLRRFETISVSLAHLEGRSDN